MCLKLLSFSSEFKLFRAPSTLTADNENLTVIASFFFVLKDANALILSPVRDFSEFTMTSSFDIPERSKDLENLATKKDFLFPAHQLL